MDFRQITVPTPLDIGPVHLYLVRQDPLTLIDAGPKHSESWKALRDGLKQHGIRPSQIRKLILTHSHEDHFGQACQIQSESGCAILAHEWELDNLRKRRDYHYFQSLLETVGVPRETIGQFQQAYLGLEQYCEPIAQALPLSDGEFLNFDRGALKVIHTPGHTPGSICLFEKATRVLIAGDMVLDGISPNPLLNPDPVKKGSRFPALSHYLNSLEKLSQAAPAFCWTSHGKPVHDYSSYRRDLEALIAQRQQKILGLLSAGSWTAWQLSLQVFPDADGVHRFLALSEITSHLDYAAENGRAASELRGGVEYWGQGWGGYEGV
ncbi:MAG TPA: MBL fold metallo-hydrolase [Acidobacteriota bacterium]|jgi:glyoxylase-like metal-dependent hydrolase (beta-lactamase superfamily II)